MTTGGVDRESVQALEVTQNPNLTAKEMTATQKRDPKQTYASEGAMKFCANNRGRDNLKFQAQASARGLPKHSWNQPQTINAQTSGPERNFFESSDRKQ